MRSNLFGQNIKVGQQAQAFVLQNRQMLKARLNGNKLYALQGAMVAYQGNLKFDGKFQGVGRLLKRSITGEGFPMMEVSGTGEVYMSHNASEIHLVYLEDDSITIAGNSVLAFEETLQWDVKMVHGIGFLTHAGFFNLEIKGTGWLALTTFGIPVVLQSSVAPTFADFNSAVAWSSNLKTNFHQSWNMKAFIGWGSGEAYQMSFEGDGIVIVQASEGPPDEQYGKSTEGDKQQKSS
jgi:uncharacterized protein (AIM24 family)